MQALVSIIIPTYNRAHLIGETLDSIIAQTYTNWECIIVDDGSTDNTIEVVTDYIKKDNRFKFYKRPKDKPKGANACRNYGFEKSNGEYINWFDSDDVMSLNKLKLTLDYLINENADLIVCGYSDSIFFEDSIINPKKFESNSFFEKFIVERISILTGDVLFKRSIVENYNFDENLHKGQEYDFFIRVFQQPLCYVFIETKLWYHRQTEDSISAFASKMNLTQINSLIYLSTKIQTNFSFNFKIVNTAKYNGIKIYKRIVKKNMVRCFFKNFTFFSSCFSFNKVEMFLWFLYNITTKKGFDKIKKNYKSNL